MTFNALRDIVNYRDHRSIGTPGCIGLAAADYLDFCRIEFAGGDGSRILQLQQMVVRRHTGPLDIDHVFAGNHGERWVLRKRVPYRAGQSIRILRVDPVGQKRRIRGGNLQRGFSEVLRLRTAYIQFQESRFLAIDFACGCRYIGLATDKCEIANVQVGRCGDRRVYVLNRQIIADLRTDIETAGHVFGSLQ